MKVSNDMTFIDIKKEEFEPFFLDIKERYLSSTNFPKLIIGTGLSIAIGVPGMFELADKLDEEFQAIGDETLSKAWAKYEEKIKTKGLEAALLDISTNEEFFVEKIREITSEFILDEEYKQHAKILNSASGFESLLKYLSETVSINNQIIDIMTPNYDRIIEIICDKLKLPLTLGFSGNLYQRFDENILKTPHAFYSKNITLVRLFKPHGSVNWIKEDGKDYQLNDYRRLKVKKENINIIAPGSFKYKSSMVNSVFRYHREIFNELISESKKSYSIFIYGYGFNDQHFNTAFEDTKKDVLVLTKTMKKSFLEKAMKNKNWTLFYKNEEGKEELKLGCYMIYKGQQYSLNEDLWDMDVFSKVFLG